MAFETLESSGIYLGVLQEDMADTMKKTQGGRFIDVFIEGVFSDKNSKYPYTYVDGVDDLPRLHKGDEVWVKFEQGSYLYPKFYKKVEKSESALYTPKHNGERIMSADTLGDGLIQGTDKRLGLYYGQSKVELGDKIQIENNSIKIKDLVDSITECVQDIVSLFAKMITPCSSTPYTLPIATTISESMSELIKKVSAINAKSVMFEGDSITLPNIDYDGVDDLNNKTFDKDWSKTYESND